MSTPIETEALLRPKHPELHQYSPHLLDPALLTGDPAKIVTEEVEQLYKFRLFTPETCRLLVEEAEHFGHWRTEADVEENPYDSEVKEYCLPDTTQHLARMNGLDRVYDEIAKRHLIPLIQSLWRTFKVQKVERPYILKYSADQIRSMDLHYDLETCTLVTYLNDEFEGGGTHFPRWKYNTGKQAPGTAILYPGGISHEHEGLAITSGKRYLMCGSFY